MEKKIKQVQNEQLGKYQEKYMPANLRLFLGFGYLLGLSVDKMIQPCRFSSQETDAVQTGVKNNWFCAVCFGVYFPKVCH